MYYKYSDYLKNKYGEKVYKLPIDLNGTCPNRDGTIGTKGCYFCSEVGTGFESLSTIKSVSEQLKINMSYIGKRYGAKKFIAYFQNYTNTYMPLEKFKKVIWEAAIENVVEICISTRPDCISVPYLDALHTLSFQKNVEISIELGLQSVNDQTLLKINRGHDVACFINAVKMIQQYPFSICTHLILNLPWDKEDDCIKAAKLMNTLKINQVKIHSLYIAKNTILGDMYLDGKLELCTIDAYVRRVAAFLCHLNKDICVQRLLARAPKDETLFCNWNSSWWKIHDQILYFMNTNGLSQGQYVNT